MTRASSNSINVDGVGEGASSYLQLSDTISDFTGKAQMIPFINDAEDAIEHADGLLWDDVNKSLGVGVAPHDTYAFSALDGQIANLRFVSSSIYVSDVNMIQMFYNDRTQFGRRIDMNTNDIIRVGKIDCVNLQVNTAVAAEVGQIWTATDTDGNGEWGDGGYGGYGGALVLRQLVVGSDGGTSVAGINILSWNQPQNSTIAGASYTEGNVTIPAGTYHISAQAPAVGAGAHHLRTYAISGSAMTIWGSESHSDSTTENDFAHISGVVTIDNETVFKLEHHIETAKVGDGLGSSGGSSTAFLAYMTIIKLA